MQRYINLRGDSLLTGDNLLTPTGSEATSWLQRLIDSFIEFKKHIWKLIDHVFFLIKAVRISESQESCRDFFLRSYPDDVNERPFICFQTSKIKEDSAYRARLPAHKLTNILLRPRFITELNDYEEKEATGRLHQLWRGRNVSQHKFNFFHKSYFHLLMSRHASNIAC